jgi:AcrR family transcriptional regulator
LAVSTCHSNSGEAKPLRPVVYLSNTFLWFGSMVERGFANATTLEIATRARVSKRELYALVGNKEQMLAACAAARGDRMRLAEGFSEPTDRASLEIALRRFGETMLRELSEADRTACRAGSVTLSQDLRA